MPAWQARAWSPTCRSETRPPRRCWACSPTIARSPHGCTTPGAAAAAGRSGQHPPVFDARLARGDRTGDERSWSIQTPDLDLQVVWRAFETPVVSYRGDDPEVYAQRSLFNVLLFAREAEVHANGVRIDGAPYTDGRWRPVIGGGDRSSCVVALAETFITPA